MRMNRPLSSQRPSSASGYVGGIRMPNLPGMMPNKDSWLLMSQQGFNKKPSIRPGTASKNDHIGPSLSAFFSNQDGEGSRPYTAGKNELDGRMDANGISYYNSDNNTRPTTATPGGDGFGVGALSQSMPNFTATNFQSRPSTANGYLGEHYSRPSSPQKMPSFVEKDKQVCRFFAYFEQNRVFEKDGPLGDPTIEKKIIRKVIIYYYLVDDTIEIYEPPVTNAGMPSGTFYRRGKVVKDDGTQLALQELAPGKTYNILGQTFFVTETDKFTRDYFQAQFSITLGSGLVAPSAMRKDLGAQYATGLGAHQKPKIKSSFGTRSTDYLQTKEMIDKTNRFLRYDGRVLRFQCVEVRSNRPPFFPHLQNMMMKKGYYGLVASADVKRYAMSYYLSTSNIEVVVQRVSGKQKEDGQDEPKLIMKKSKLPRNWREAQRGRTPQYYEPRDFRCGEVVDVYGRYFLLVNCDAFTREVYAEMNDEQQEVLLVAENHQPVKQPIPQLGDGFLAIGSPEDTLATVYGMPKPGKDLEKVQRNQNRLLRCKAKLLSSNRIDTSRVFLITFFLEDDTVQVFEESKRNSGIWSGNYLKRGRYNNDLPNDGEIPRPFAPNDIYLGNVISLLGNEFQIIEMDNHSLLFCENVPDEFPMCDTFKIIASLMKLIIEKEVDIRAVFRANDKELKNYTSREDFIDTLESVNLTSHLNDQELLTLMRRFQDHDRYYYEEMCDLVSHVYFANHSPKASSSAGGKASKKSAGGVSTLAAYLDVMRGRTIQWRRMLRKDVNTLDGCLTLSILEKLMSKHGVIATDEVYAEIRQRFSAPPDIATPILEELQRTNADLNLYEGFEKKVRPKIRHSNPNMSNKTYAMGLIATQAAASRRRTSNVGSVLRGTTNVIDTVSTADDPGYLDHHTEKVVIDFNELCDAIYICDWI